MAASDDLLPSPGFNPVTPLGTSQVGQRLAERDRLRALRAERLARLRPDPRPDRTAVGDDGALAEFLSALSQAAVAPDGPAPLAPEPAPPAAAVLHFHRPGAPETETSDIGRLPGVGPGLAWALRRAGFARRADLSDLEPPDLVARLGPLGRLVPAAAWIAAGRAATARPAAAEH